MKILMTGATGLIGTRVSKFLIDRGDELTIITRDAISAAEKIPGAVKYYECNLRDDDFFELSDLISEAEAVINLAGENIAAGRWSAEQKKKILNSRKLNTRKLVETINTSEKKPKTFISASAVGFYGNSSSDIFDENSKPGKTFLAEVTEAWEEEVKLLDSSVREVRLRLGVVLAGEGGALPKMIPPFKYFIGGPLGSGRQWFPWIHIEDVVRFVIHSLEEKLDGPYNLVAPQFVTMNDLAKALGKALKRPYFFKVPGFVLKIILGEQADMVLGGARISPLELSKVISNFLINL